MEATISGFRMKLSTLYPGNDGTIVCSGHAGVLSIDNMYPCRTSNP